MTEALNSLAKNAGPIWLWAAMVKFSEAGSEITMGVTRGLPVSVL